MTNLNPLQQYALGEDPPVTNKSVVVNGVYAVHGVIDTIGSNTNSFYDPTLNQFNTSLPIVVPDNRTHTIWTSDIVDDEVYNTYTLNFKFNSSTYINRVHFDLLAVPCSWYLYRNSTLLTQGIVELYDSSTYIHNNLDLGQTYLFDDTNELKLVIVKSVTGTQYQFSVQNFLAKLVVKDKSSVTVDNNIIDEVQVQNRFNFVENYQPVVYSGSNILSSDPTDYWKCAPQPVGDAVVYLNIDLGSLQTFNRIYIDPLYTGTSFNLYWSYDNYVWSPVQRDFKLRRGFYELPTVSARYLKFEFTQLTPEPYQLPFDLVERTVEVFPDWVDSYFVNIERAISTIPAQRYSQSAAIAPSVSYNTQIVANNLYGTAFSNLGDVAFGASPSISQAQATLNSTNITDPTVSYKTLTQINGRGSRYNPVTDITFITRRFPLVGTHVYKRVQVQQTWHHAYFTGIKQLKVYSSNYSPQLDYPEFTDYLLSSGVNTIISGTVNMPTFRAPNLVTTSGTTTISGGGYQGSSGNQLYTKNLKTLTQYDSFKLAMLSSQWTSLGLTDSQITLRSTDPTSLSSLGIVTSGVASVQSIPSYSQNYSIYEVTTSGSTSNYLQSASVGGQNLLTSSEANFVFPGGWSANTSTGVTNTTITGMTKVSLGSVNTTQWNSAYGESAYGAEAFGASTTLGDFVNSNYTFLLTVSGTANSVVTPSITYSGTAVVSGIATASGYTVSSGFTISGTTNIVFTTTKPGWATEVRFAITNSGGTDYYSKASFAVGSGTYWTSPLVTSGMRISALSRVYLPNTNYGTYRCSLYSGDTELAYRQYSNLPTKTWIDIEVPFTLVSGYYSYDRFSVRLTQNNGQNEKYRVALLGTFFNPVSVEYCSDGTGSNWNWVTAGINDPYVSINLRGPSNQLQLRATMLQDNTTISSISIIPNYQQSPLYSTTTIDYLGDPKTNELSWRRTPAQRPLFQLGTEIYPTQYDQSILMGIPYPYSLD